MQEGGEDTQLDTTALEEQQSKGPGSHTRTYQACIPCRRRKVRCDLGPVDNPHDPPCVRCRRESKECFFSATRRKRKAGDDDDNSDYEVRNGRKRNTSIPAPLVSPAIPQHPQGFHDVPNRPLTPGGSIGRTQPLRRPAQGQEQMETEYEHEHEDDNNAIPVLQEREVFSGHDALNLLFAAAHHRTGSTSSSRPQFTANGLSPSTATSYASPTSKATRPPSGPRQSSASYTSNPNLIVNYQHAEDQKNVKDQIAIEAWTRLRFVRAGLFTAREGMAYIDYFYKNMSPLTPIIVPDYEDHSKHPTLLKEEPMLLITLLTITSRYMALDGPGKFSRPYHIHLKLWEYLQGMITRLVWGQEQFGGGFCGAGGQPSSEVNPLTRKGLRTLGTVESLMLLTEWHPRALHFPPNDDDDELLLSQGASNVNGAVDPGLLPPELFKGLGGQRIDAWLEPCWRSDRVCWMLLGIAMSVAFEIGIFNEASDADVLKENLPRQYSEQEIAIYVRRKNQLKQLLVVYGTQTSGRLGLTSMLPKMQSNQSILKAPGLNQLAEFATAQLRSPSASQFDQRELMPQSPMFTGVLPRESIQDIVVRYWSDVAKLFEAGNVQLFPNRKQTRELISSNRYWPLLDFFAPIHESWKQTLESDTTIPTVMKHVLRIEVEYSRVYVNSLALQAVIDRCAHRSPHHNRSSSNADGGAIPFSTLKEWTGSDRKYIDQVVDAARTVLSIVVEGLVPGDVLKHAPVRTFFRIVSTAIILLKTFALGATEEDVHITLSLMDRASSALQTNIVDDVHVGNRFAELLQTLTNRIRSGFIRMPQTNNVEHSRATTRSPAPRIDVLMPPPLPRQNNMSNNNWSAYLNNSGATTPIMGTQSPSMSNVNPQTTPSHPLWGITTEAYDPSSNNAATIVPPPSFPMHNSYDVNGQFQFPTNEPGNGYDMGANGADLYGAGSDWLTLPLDNLLNSSNYGDVTQTPYGPDIGGFDILDILVPGSNTDFGSN